MNNKHPHYDLIVQWAKDTSKQVQYMSAICGDSWCDICGNDPVWDRDVEYRFKPREFQKGHWYPCVFNKTGHEVLMVFDVCGFKSSPMNSNGWGELDFTWIGESLGEINFE